MYLLQNDENIVDGNNIQFDETGATALSDDAFFTLKTISFQRDAMAVRIHCLSNNASAVTCEYSIDQGENWLPMDQNRDTVFPVPQKSIQIRCFICSVGTVLQGLDLTEIHESNPVRFKSTLLRAVSPFTLIIPATNNTALLSLEKETDEASTISAVYIDGILQKDSQTVSLLPYEENTRHTIALAGINENSVLYGSGAHAAIILRSTPDATDEFESGQIDLTEDTYILRAEANNYLLGIWTGKGKPEDKENYSYHFIGNTTSYSTQGKKLWITEAENNNNQYAIHWDGSGQELVQTDWNLLEYTSGYEACFL